MIKDILHNILRRTTLKRLLLFAVIFNVQWSMVNVFAQITVGGNVYGGGNVGEVKGNTTVTVRAGDLNNVFGGARVANVGGRTFVNIDGKNASDDILAKAVYGGNDISGTIGQNAAATTSVPAELENVKTGESDNDQTHNAIDNSWKTFVRTSACSTKQTVTVGEGANTTTVTADDKLIVIGTLFGGGNGDYDYTSPKLSDNVTDNPYYGLAIPELSKTYIEIKGGCIAHLYGGGNNATVTEATVINIDNESDDLEKAAMVYASRNNITDPRVVLANLQRKVKLTSFQSNLSSFAFNHARIYGGNNKATMNIMPKWNLQKGIIRDLYSGGNEGNMTYKLGLLLDIDPIQENKDKLVINNVYGGCRRADVNPLQDDGTQMISTDIQLPNTIKDNNGNEYLFPAGLPARTLVRGGKITNVYGGNDISGRVFGGNAVGIYTSILGDVYGGGNGSYAYTDNAELGKLDEFKDYYYDINEVKQKEAAYNSSAPQTLTSVEALNIFRPNAEQVSIRLKGTDENHPTIIRGSVYVGGNCATLLPKKPSGNLIEVKMGSHVIADKVFLGNNGENMIDEKNLKYYAGNVNKDGEYTTEETSTEVWDFSSLDLRNSGTFAEYMEGVTMTQMPDIVFDETPRDPADYEDNSSKIGSFFFGGNVGSMAIAGTQTYDFDRDLVVYEKVVGGCNSADVEKSAYNAAYEGGVLGSKEERGNKGNDYYTVDGTEKGTIKDRLIINLTNLNITPMRWKVETYNASGMGIKDENDNYVEYKNPDTGLPELEWNTMKWMEYYTAVAADTTLTAGKPYFTSSTGAGKFIAKGNEVANGSDYYVFLKNGFEIFSAEAADANKERRLLGGNIYGGCYNSGHVNGNIIINIDENTIQKDDIFATGTGKAGVDFDSQRNDVMALAMTVFGAGKGENTEIWGSTTVNLNKGYTLQVFGGGEEGIVGKHLDTSEKEDGYYDDDTDEYTTNGRKYKFDPRYSCTVNLKSYSSEDTGDDLAEAEYIYGGGNEGDVCGNITVNLGNGRIYDAFGGCSDADVLGHTEVYIGRQPQSDGTFKDGFPRVRDIVYGGNDFGGTIHGNFETGFDFTKRVRNWDGDKAKIHGYTAPTGNAAETIPEVLQGVSYVEYLQGRVDTIFGASYGYYDYSDEKYMDDEGNYATMPLQQSSFVNIRPNDNDNNALTGVFGGGTGYPGYRKGDESLERSYVLVDIPEGKTQFASTEIFGSGSYNGLGMKFDPAETFTESFAPDRLSAIIDLLHGQIGNVYGGSYNEGVTARTVVNVPESATIKVNNIFGGSYGTHTLPPCDVFESNVNYKSEQASVSKIYGGNNKERRTLYAKVNISSPVWSNKEKGYLANVFGAGRGVNTWSEYTEVNLNSGARVYEVYGGGEEGHVLCAETAYRYMTNFFEAQGCSSVKDPKWLDAWTLGDYFTPDPTADDPFSGYVENSKTNLANDYITRKAEMDDRDLSGLTDNVKERTYKKYNTNVIIKQGATVENYAYGGGLGTSSIYQSGDVWGTTYVALLGGVVKKNIYAAGSSGSVTDAFRVMNNFPASANAYIEGGSVRNIFGGGWEGHVGNHTKKVNDVETYAGLNDPYDEDIPGETHVVIGKVDGTTHFNGIPAVERNAYGGGEGGSVYGTANLTINNGYIGYRYLGADAPYHFTYTGSEVEEHPESDVLKAAGTALADCFVEKIDDETNYKDGKWKGKESLNDCGNLYGSGYDDLSSVDITNVNLYGGVVRNCVFGGGEVSIVGRGTKTSVKATPVITKAGQTNVNMFNGHVLHNVYGGGKGYNTLGYGGGHNLNTDGNIFGQTRVNIHGGEIGTEDGALNAGESNKVGNVFGGGDAGLVYSALEDASGKLLLGKKSGKRYNEGISPENTDEYDYQGYYYKWDGTKFLTHNVAAEGQPEKLERYFTEDCKVVVEPWLQVKTSPITYGGKTYAVGDYVPTAYLNTLKAKMKDDLDWPIDWSNLDTGTGTTERGIIIHNAVFAGGNIAMGSNNMFANEMSVFGNATASIHDVYNRDFITIGTGHIGGLYGDGNLTFVDGYRELNITNYGTDYFHLEKELSTSDYRLLPEREKAYYELKYKLKADECTDNEGTTYKKDATLPLDELIALFTNENGASMQLNDVDIIITDNEGKRVPNPDIWEENGVVSTYAGRLLNTIQRADFCGVFGSRMVMKGARDRVPEIVDYTNYTINRVREVSLNKMDTPAGDTDELNKLHGNYFGIYSVVNYLGALTSDVKFDDIRTTKANLEANPHLEADGTTTFAEWKAAHLTERTRNNGNCHNQLALASGVSLELTTEKSTGNTLDTKDWGLITGVIELDLINVQPGIGGGFVYAKNEHGKVSPSTNVTTTLTALNGQAVTQWDYTYKTLDADREKWQTSGNFIHSSQTILDDCYNISGRYLSTSWVPAHYWYVSGSVYIYDQYISAYTGAPNAYSKTVEIPVTINAASNGRMTLMDVQPNRYAYYSSYANESTNTPLTGDKKLVINDVTYQLNDPISYWDWNKLPKSQKELFVADTYVVVEDCKIGSTPYEAGKVLLNKDYDALIVNNNYPTVTKKKLVDGVEQDVEVPFTDVFRSSNNLSHETGYILTYKVTNPDLWNQWYTQVDNDSDHNRVKNQTGGDTFEDGPTYHPTVNGLYGQKEYNVDDIIPEDVYTTYNSINTTYIPNYGLSEDATGYDANKKQAVFVPAYVVTKEYSDESRHLYPGAAVHEAISGYTEIAYVCSSTIQLSSSEFVYLNDLMTLEEKTALYNRFYKNGAGSDAEKKIAKDINDLIVPAYYCTSDGLYGGNYYDTDKNYRGLAAWSAMSDADREKFEFNYDALDLLIDPLYSKNASGTVIHPEGKKYQYDSNTGNPAGAEANAAHYSLKTPIDYTATYNSSTNMTLESEITVRRNGNPATTKSVQADDELTREVYESLPNERRHYAAVSVSAAGDYYVVNNGFVHIETSYAAGATISSEDYNKLTDSEKVNVTKINIPASAILSTTSEKNPQTFYFCREAYIIGGTGEQYEVKPATGVTAQIYQKTNETTNTYSFTDATNSNTYTSGEVPVGLVIDATNYGNLINKQMNFTIHGMSPMETSTLYVSRNSDINDLSTEKIITVIYKYDYEESDESGQHITPISERHVVNIHIKFESGVPIIDDIREPDIVLPGTSISPGVPQVTTGAYDILERGWEIFETPGAAESHNNGVKYTPSSDPLYWYQDGFYLAYYAKTYLGKTYSNHVPVHVANYHDLKEVMDDKTHHMYVDYDRTRLKRDAKIYINDYSPSENGLDLFKDFYDLSLLTSSSAGVSNGVVTAVGRLKDQTLLNNSTAEGTNIHDNQTYTKGVKAGKNLEFFLRTDIDHSKSEWTSIGETDCFAGTLHGDGHHLSGLSNSLFNHLCGDVYNLGVSGTFTGAGIAETGSGYVESCWTSTSTTMAKTTQPVFGIPLREANDERGLIQMVNCYYEEDDEAATTAASDDPEKKVAYTNHDSSKTYGIPTRKPSKAFYTGEVAYDLNNFYLYKRYNDNAKPTGATTYKYWQTGNDTPQEGSYASNAYFCSSGVNSLQYVEDRFADGDFRYAAGEIPTSEDERLYTETVNEKQVTHFYPIWPDDYIFFGQKLTFGYGTETHQDVPTAVARDGGRLSQNADANRVYRAPAYYQSKAMGVAHFNPTVYLAAKEKLTDEQIENNVTAREAYPRMTAIDFAGHNDTDYTLGANGAWFYQPLLDDDGLVSIANCDETKNLLVYAPAETATGGGYANKMTYDVLTGYFTDPVYTDYYDNSKGYRLVREYTSSVLGHLVQSDLTATNDHLLVDKEDFNAPISYSFANGKRMWYQRKPDSYVDIEWSNDATPVRTTKGWEGISIPFEAELVSTNEKGELTHFYKKDEGFHDDYDTGHEYWLRELTGFEKNQPADGIMTGKFLYPTTTGSSADDKTVTNTFLWDYYYNEQTDPQHQDANKDTYQTYYNSSRSYKGYPLLSGAKAYIIGFPGKRYYEFDLSGQFEPRTTAEPQPARLDRQTVTFASNPDITIAVSDDEQVTPFEGYVFKPNYLNKTFEANANAYTLNAAGNSYDKVPTDKAADVVAFRPFFEPKANASRETRSIVFSQSQAMQMSQWSQDDGKPGTLSARAARHKIVVSSAMKVNADVRIINAAGQTVATFTIEPGQTIETPIRHGGVYIVQSVAGEYTRKFAVK